MHSGMHWLADGLSANLALSCYVPTGRYADAWEHRVEAT